MEIGCLSSYLCVVVVVVVVVVFLKIKTCTTILTECVFNVSYSHPASSVVKGYWPL